MTVKKKSDPPMKIKDLFRHTFSLVKDTQHAAVVAKMETVKMQASVHDSNILIKNLTRATGSHSKYLVWVLLMMFVDLGAIALLGHHQTIELQEQNTQLMRTLQSNGDALSSMSESVNELSDQYKALNAHLDLYVPGYTKYLYYNQESGKVEVYNIAQTRRIKHKGSPGPGLMWVEDNAIAVKDLDSYFKSTHSKK